MRGEPTLPQFTLLIKADLKVRIKYVWVQLSAGSSWSVKMMTAKSSWKRWIILTDFWSYCQDHRVDVKVYPAFFFLFYFFKIFCCVTCLLVINSCRMQTAAALKQKKESLFKGKSDSDPCFWQRTKGLSGDQVTAMWHWGISALHSLWLNITVADRERLQTRSAV